MEGGVWPSESSMFCSSGYGSITLIDAGHGQRDVRSILLPTKAISYSSPVLSTGWYGVHPIKRLMLSALRVMLSAGIFCRWEMETCAYSHAPQITIVITKCAMCFSYLSLQPAT